MGLSLKARIRIQLWLWTLFCVAVLTVFFLITNSVVEEDGSQCIPTTEHDEFVEKIRQGIYDPPVGGPGFFAKKELERYEQALSVGS